MARIKAKEAAQCALAGSLAGAEAAGAANDSFIELEPAGSTADFALAASFEESLPVVTNTSHLPIRSCDRLKRSAPMPTPARASLHFPLQRYFLQNPTFCNARRCGRWRPQKSYS